MTRDVIERTQRTSPLDPEDPPQFGSMYDAHEVWAAYDRRDQDLKRARWTAVVVAWIMAHDDMATKLVEPMDLAELIDLDSVLTDLRHKVRQVISQQDIPTPGCR